MQHPLYMHAKVLATASSGVVQGDMRTAAGLCRLTKTWGVRDEASFAHVCNRTCHNVMNVVQGMMMMLQQSTEALQDDLMTPTCKLTRLQMTSLLLRRAD